MERGLFPSLDLQKDPQTTLDSSFLLSHDELAISSTDEEVVNPALW